MITLVQIMLHNDGQNENYICTNETHMENRNYVKYSCLTDNKATYPSYVIVTSLFYLEYILHVHSIKRSLYRFLLTRLD